MTLTALTLGPIYKTLQRADNTRSLWGASMLFSYIMGVVIKKLKKSHNVLLPYYEDAVNKKEPDHIGTGLVSDRLFVQSENGMQNELQKIIDTSIDEFFLATNIGSKDFWRSYLRFSILETEIPELASKSVNEIGYVSNFLNAFELQDLPLKGDFNNMKVYLEKGAFTPIFQQYFRKTKKGFDSLFEIAVRELTASLNEDAYEDFIKDFYENIQGKSKLKKDINLVQIIKNKFQGDFRKHHKYVCVVHADGDGIGTLITQSPLAEAQCLSKAMFAFGVDAQKIINNYGAMPLYIGGDDLLFFAPFRNIHASGESKNIFQLIDALDKCFKKNIKTDTVFEYKENISLSFGLSITYYKHPMQEAIQLSHSLMEHQAKKLVKEKGIKNNLSCTVELHSDPSFGLTLDMDTARRAPFDALCDWLNQRTSGEEDERFFNSIIKKIKADKYLLQLLLNRSDSEARLINYFNNNFDEDEHSNNPAFFKRLSKITNTLKTAKTPYLLEDEAVAAVDDLYTLMRFIQFINQKAEHE